MLFISYLINAVCTTKGMKRKVVRFSKFITAAVCTCTALFLWINRRSPTLGDGPVDNLTFLNSSRVPYVTRGQGPPILLWWDSVYTSVDTVKQCWQLQCRVTNNRSLQHHPDTKAFIFYGSHFRPYNLPFPRKSGATWALIHEESPRNAYILSHGQTMAIFNFSSTYNRKSDYPITTQWLKCPDWLQDTKFLVPLADKNRLRKEGMAPILYLQSDCGAPSDRDSLVKLLMKYIPIDSYGPCVNNKKLPGRLRFRHDMAPMEDEEFYRFVARYKFTLALENYVCDDYITEKVWRPLRLGSVPIVFGAPNIREYLPNNKSAILVDDFSDVRELARYIKRLDMNDDRYLEYLQFKHEPLQNHYLQTQLDSRNWQPQECKEKNSGESSEVKYASIFHGYECFLCEKAHILNRILNSGLNPQTLTSNPSHYQCSRPKMFDPLGRYNVQDDKWAAEWDYGKYEAIAMSYLYEAGKGISESAFHKLVNTIANEDMDKLTDKPPMWYQ